MFRSVHLFEHLFLFEVLHLLSRLGIFYLASFPRPGGCVDIAVDWWSVGAPIEPFSATNNNCCTTLSGRKKMEGVQGSEAPMLR